MITASRPCHIIQARNIMQKRQPMAWSIDNSGARLAGRLLAISVMAALLAGCGGLDKDRMSTGSIADDYRTRHPITLTEVEHALEVPVASGDRGLTQGTRDVVAGFAADYKRSASGAVQMFVPSVGYNAGAAHAARREVRNALIAGGVPSNRIIETGYQPESLDAPAPIRLAYVATTAMTSRCGEWPEDLANDTLQNRNWSNFGCASQNNLAAQIENPMDLVAPRRQAPIDAAQRARVLKVYREGAATTTE